ncbi:MAG: hypothetical protein PHG35_09115 [Dehalococcoidales bacterium]|nr:hypothetical protein [Dehalococcoidales bacterium]
MEQDANFLYNDGLITIYQDKVVFRNCFWPWVDKTVPVNKIVKIISFKPSIFKGSGKLWGTRGPNIWFAWDLKRPSRDRTFHCVIKDEFFIIGFSAKDSALVENIFREMHLLESDQDRV